jgi:hypothetical protein
MHYIKRLIITGLTAVALATTAGALAPVPAFADASTDAAKAVACQGAGGTISNGKCVTPGPSLSGIVKNVVGIISVLIGIAAVIMIMVSGFKYVTANGDSGNVNSAKQTLIYAVIGLVIAALAQFIVQFVITRTQAVPEDEDAAAKTTAIVVR